MQAAFVLEAGLFVGFHTALVEAEHIQLDAVEIQLGESKAQNDFHGVGAVALAPKFTYANANANPGAPNMPVEACQVDHANFAVVTQRLDGEGMHPADFFFEKFLRQFNVVAVGSAGVRQALVFAVRVPFLKQFDVTKN